MNKLMACVRAQGVLILFGFAITISLFLGDGKQPLIDVVWACEILFFYAIYHLQNRTLRTPPRTCEAAWVMLLGYCIVRAFFSDSVGYSLSAVVRLFDAYLVYRLFYSLSDKKHAWHVGLGLIVIGVVSVIASGVFLSSPPLIQWMPQMNLLYATYGHNQLAGLLLFGVPLVIGDGAPLPAWCKKTLAALFLFGVIFSFARGAWILVAAYLAFLLVTKRPAGKFNRAMAVTVVGAVTGLLVTMFLLAPRFVHVSPLLNNDWFFKQTVKPPAYENRIQYWTQALRAIRERPIFGSGPGTFYLQSKRLQGTPLSYSWFAHSFVLEQFVEVGLVGVILWVILFIVQWRLLAPLRTSPIFIGATLTFLYSLYEYNLNFLVIWLLFWSALGWLTGFMQFKKPSSSRPPFLVMGGIALLCVFSLFSVGGMIETAANKSEAALLFTPFVADVAITSIETHAETETLMPQNHLSLLLFFHRENPEILHAVAKYYGAMGQPDDAMRWYETAIRRDPKNVAYQQEYVRFVIENGFFSQAGPAVRQYSLNMLPDRLHGQINAIPFGFPALVTSWSKVDIHQLDSSPTDLYYAKLYYILGKNMVSENNALTKQLWTLAKDIYPDMGLLYHELAGLEFYNFHDVGEAQKTIAECMSVPHAALHCKQIQPDFSNVPPPGYVSKDIMSYHD